jgi:hypothetical protein
MSIISLVAVAKIPAKECTFARELCNAKYPVKGELLSTVQKLELLQLYAKEHLHAGRLFDG